MIVCLYWELTEELLDSEEWMLEAMELSALESELLVFTEEFVEVEEPEEIEEMELLDETELFAELLLEREETVPALHLAFRSFRAVRYFTFRSWRNFTNALA